jgi:hypothetical protein
MTVRRFLRALPLAAALAAAPVHAIDFTLLQVGGVPAALCQNNEITDVTGVAVSYDLLDNAGPNVRFSWTITPAVGPVINQSQTFTLIPQSAVQTDVQDWFDTYFGGSVPVPGPPSLPWVGTIVGSPIDSGGNVVGQSATFTVQCSSQGQASIVNVAVERPPSFPVPVDAPLALVALAAALGALGIRRARR